MEFIMDIDLLFKIAAIGILVAVLHQVLVRAGREDQAMMTTLAGLVIVLTLVIKEISTLFDSVRTMFGLWWNEAYLIYCIGNPIKLLSFATQSENKILFSKEKERNI